MELTNALDLMKTLGQMVINNPIGALITIVVVFLLLKIGRRLMHYLYIVNISSKNFVNMKVILPREESQKDKEKAEEKDFKEKIAIMEQFFRNIHEMGELSLRNIILTKIFQDNHVSFEYIAKEKVVDFHVVVHKRYQGLIEKQITSYYTNADIRVVDKLDIQPKGNHLKCYYAYQKNPFFYPIKTYKDLQNDPLNDITNIFSKLDETDIAGIQIIIRPKTGKKFQKKIEKAGTEMFAGKKPGALKIPLLGSIGSFLSMLLTGSVEDSKQQQGSGPYGGGGYVRMLQTREEIAKHIGERAGQVIFESTIRIVGSAKTGTKATEITNNIAIALNLFKDTQMNWFQTRRILPFDKLNNIIMKFNFNRRILYSKLFLLGEKISILDSSELASMFHFPSSRFNYTPVINWLQYKVLPAPVDLPILLKPTDGIILGFNEFRGEKKSVAILRKDRTRHQYCIGKSGSGKSAFLSWMARQDIINGDGLCVVDPHGDLIEELVQFTPKERAKDVIIFNPADT